jgi:hypothetical protein
MSAGASVVLVTTRRRVGTIVQAPASPLLG